MNKNLEQIWDKAAEQTSGADNWSAQIEFLEVYTRLILKSVVMINSQYIMDSDNYGVLIDDYQDYFGIKIYE